MAQIFPFQPYRYAPEAGPLEDLLTQPYDKITPAMQARYLGLSPYNLVRIILGERHWSDAGRENVYTRARRYLDEWIENGILKREAQPALYAYFQEFELPDTGERLTRHGFIGLGAVEDYSGNIVHRHEQTLSGPKKDRLDLLRETRAHFGQIFMLYPDPEGQIDRILLEAAREPALAEITDEYGAVHRLWRISDPGTISTIQQAMDDKKLLIADGHHRYETALAFRDENPELADASKVMMTFVNMHSAGLRILATHRLVSGIANFDSEAFLAKASADFTVTEVSSAGELKEALGTRDGSRIGAAVGEALYILELRERAEMLDVAVLHDILLDRYLGIGADAVREEQNVRYVRGVDAAVEEARSGAAQIAFVLRPISVDEVAEISFAGGVMPQKSTDFYPKLLSGLTIYRLEE